MLSASYTNGLVPIPTGPLYTILLEDPGTLTAVTNAAQFKGVRPPGPCFIQKVKLTVSVAPTGTPIICDVNVGGATIFGASDRPQIATGATEGETITFLSNAVRQLDENSIITLDVDQIGSGTAGSNLACHIICSRVNVPNPTI